MMVKKLSTLDYHTLADALGDTPETVVEVHFLRRGFCDAYVAGDAADFRAAIVQVSPLTEEPLGFGQDADALWALLQLAKGWTCTSVSATVASALGEIITQETGASVRYYGDVYYALHRPVPTIHNEYVRRLTLDDLPLLEAAPEELRVNAYDSLTAMLTEGIVAGAVVDSRLVGIAQAFARTTRHADVGAHTLEGWRGRGFAVAAASLVSQAVQATDLTPVWSTGEDNFASQRIAEKLGFTQVAWRTYVIPTRADA